MFLDQLGNALTNLRIALIGIAPVVAGVAWVIAKLWQMIIPEQQGRVEPREWARNAIVTYVAILIGFTFITWIGNMFSGV